MLMRGDMQAMKSDVRTTNDKMDASAQNLKNEIKASAQNIRGDIQVMNDRMDAGMQAWREDRRAMDWKMAPARGETTESRGSVEVVRPAMETGEVGMTRDATTIDVETCKTRHKGATEKLKEAKSQELTEIIK